MMMWASRPRLFAASAMACAWFPELCVTSGDRASPRRSAAFVAPRILKLPVFWSTSHLKWSARPAQASTWPQVSTGVRWTWGATRRDARRTFKGVTGKSDGSGAGATSLARRRPKRSDATVPSDAAATT